jgi:pyruvate/2-oxoglutarate dehydrogenase complex dihydrolipoamide dehydrogenase (E3) component
MKNTLQEIDGGKMKTLIVGSGVIGVIYGWALAQSGVEVTHFVRKGRQDQFKDGIQLDLLDERKGHTKYNLTKYASAKASFLPRALSSSQNPKITKVFVVRPGHRPCLPRMKRSAGRFRYQWSI